MMRAILGHLRSETGMTLVVLLVVVLAAAVAGFAMASNVVRETQIAINESNAIQARYIAEAGVAAAAAQLSQNNAWPGPLTQTLGNGSYTVQVDAAVSQTGALGVVKSLVSTGQISYAGPTPTTLGAAQQTVRETVLVLPQAFSKPMVSDTIVSIGSANANGATPTVQDTVLRQLGTVHANNPNGESPSVFQDVGTTITGRVTASGGTGTNATITLNGTCIACAPQDNAAVIPFPTFIWAHYITLAQANPSPCPAVQANTLFATQAAFDLCVAAIVPDAQGFRSLTGIIFVNARTLSLPNTAAEQLLRINGTFAVYNQTAGPCRPDPVVCGNLVFRRMATPNNLIFTAQNGEPALMVGGHLLNGNNCNTALSTGAITITGLVYILAETTDAVANQPNDPGYCVHGSTATPVTLTGALVANRITGPFDSNSLTYDPSIFFGGLPSGLNTPTGPFVVLPISWSSAK